MRKIIQIAYGGEYQDIDLTTALCDDGTVWQIGIFEQGWSKFPGIPQDTTEPSQNTNSTFIDADRSAAHAKAHAEDMYQRALKAEELLYRFYIDRDKKAEGAILNFVQDGLDKEGL